MTLGSGSAPCSAEASGDEEAVGDGRVSGLGVGDGVVNCGVGVGVSGIIVGVGVAGVSAGVGVGVG